MSKRSLLAPMRKYYYSDNPRAPLQVHRAEVPLTLRDSAKLTLRERITFY